MAISNPKSLLYVITWYDNDELKWHYDPTLSKKTGVRNVKELMNDELSGDVDSGDIMVIKAPKTPSLAWVRDVIKVVTGDGRIGGRVKGTTYTPKQFLRKFG